MEYFLMAYGRDFEPMAEIFFNSYVILEFYAMSTCWPNVHWGSRQTLPCWSPAVLPDIRKIEAFYTAYQVCVLFKPWCCAANTHKDALNLISNQFINKTVQI